MSKGDLVYELEGKPELRVAIPLGLQHVLAMFTGNIAPIIIIANTLGLPEDSKILMIQSAMIVAGIVTLIQLYPVWKVGAGLPIVMGTSFAFVPTAVAVGSKYGISGILGSSFLGSFTEVIIGFFIKPLKKYFPPIVMGTVLFSIGISLLPVGIQYFAGGVGAADFGSPENLFLGFLVLLIIIVLQGFGKGIFNTASILIALVIGYIVAIPMGKIDFTSVSQAGWLSIPKPLEFGMEFHLDAILKFAAVYLIVSLETLGNVSGITISTLGREAVEREMTGAVLADGLGSTLAAVFNVLPNTGYGQNVGIIALTKVVNKFCIATGGIFLIIAGIIPKFGAICAAMPPSVLGGAVTVVFSMITISGIRMIGKAGLDGKNATILSVSIGVGIGFSQVPDSMVHFPKVLQHFFSDPVVAAGILALILNIIFTDRSTIKESEATESNDSIENKDNLSTEKI